MQMQTVEVFSVLSFFWKVFYNSLIWMRCWNIDDISLLFCTQTKRAIFSNDDKLPSFLKKYQELSKTWHAFDYCIVILHARSHQTSSAPSVEYVYAEKIIPEPFQQIQCAPPFCKILRWERVSNRRLEDENIAWIGSLANLERTNQPFYKTTDGRNCPMNDTRMKILSFIGSLVIYLKFLNWSLENSKNIVELSAQALFIFHNKPQVVRQSRSIMHRCP